MTKRVTLQQLEDWLSRFNGQGDNTRLLALRVLLYIADRREVSSTDIQRDFEVVQSVAHRNLQRLYQGSDSVQVGRGLELIERFPDPREPRRHLYRLSPKGQKYLEELVE